MPTRKAGVCGTRLLASFLLFSCLQNNASANRKNRARGVVFLFGMVFHVFDKRID